MVVVCITQLFKDRKIEELLASVEATPNVYLVIGGKGILESRVKAAAAANPRIKYIGFVSAPDIPVYTCAADVVFYGFDPHNPNAKFSAPNKLFEALAAGKPLITGDFGEIAEVVRQAGCGIVLREYSAASIAAAFVTLQQAQVRSSMATNAKHFGDTWMNWPMGEEILYREYSKLLPFRLTAPIRQKGAAPVVSGDGSMSMKAEVA
jgi:glycosyltransferase involved in cell wall biosynthesis